MAQNDPAAFTPVPAPFGSPQSVAKLYPLQVSNPAPRPVLCDELVTEGGDRLVTDGGLGFCVVIVPCPLLITGTGDRLVTDGGLGFCVAPSFGPPP